MAQLSPRCTARLECCVALCTISKGIHGLARALVHLVLSFLPCVSLLFFLQSTLSNL